MNITSHKLNKGIAKIVGILVLTSFSHFSAALFVGPITASPQGSATLKDNQVNTARVTWSGSSDSASSNFPGQSYSVFSNNGQFFVGQNSVATNNRRISATLIIGALSPFIIQETMQVPRSVLAAAKRSNTTLVQYVRTFSDESGGTDITSVATFQIVSSNNGTLSLSQVDLRFSNKNLSKVVKVDEALSAYAAINHGGTGLFQAIWEIATPISTTGTPIFTRLETIRQFLGAGRNIIIESPTLPTNLAGNYILRLRITSPADTFDNLQLRYSVIPSNTPTIVLQNIIIRSPLPNSVINEATLFSWQPIQEANTYQIEIYETDNTNLPSIGGDSLSNESENNQNLSSGVLLPSERTSSTLTKIALQHLKPGRNYQWRTVAINKDGYIIGKSPYRKVRLGR